MDPLIVAHRGASQQAPENTLPAIKKALEAGVDMLALDVQKTKDDQPILLADVSLDRTTNGTGRASRMSGKEIAALDAGGWFDDDFTGAKVPLLSEALKTTGEKARLLLALPENKPGSPWPDALAAVLKVRKKPAEDILLFSDSDSLKHFREKAPDFSYALALDERVDGWLYLEKAEKLSLKHVRPHRSQVDAVLVRQAHAKNIVVIAHFANEESDLRSLLELRVDGIVTGRPERLKTLMAEFKK
ncbi:MAG TPA: glycerophosphodiester phosphodiesterase family protein [Planctomycetota bacterium]|nr:glycerophosphodiester phosphodiesterase family protein [Planctomycetota bacterium]